MFAKPLSALRRAPLLVLVMCLSMLLSTTSVAWAAPDAKLLAKEVQQGIAFLAKAQEADGGFTGKFGPGITALVVTSVLRHGRSAEDPIVAKGLKFLEAFVQPSGGIHHPKSPLKNYETCLSMLCFKEANKDGRYDKILKNGNAFVRGLQKDSGEGKTEADVEFGGAGYGDKERPDLSNTHFLVEALRETGTPANDESIQRALVFISRCQNLESAHNTTAFAAKVNDGSFYYTPSGEGSSPAGKTDQGGLRGYGAMTYAGLKSMIFAGVGPDDPRVKAAVKFAERNYDISSNPNMGQSGVYYYYQLFAKALDAMGSDTITDANGVKHDWRAELVVELGKRQEENGSWVNTDKRWLEGDPNLSTGFALLALSYCRPDAKAKK